MFTPTRIISPPNTWGSVTSGAEAYIRTNTESGKTAIVPAELLNRVKPTKEAYETLLTDKRIQLSVRHICKGQGQKYLISGPDLNKLDKKGTTALCQAARDNDIETFHILNKVRANLDATDKKGNTALMHAASSNHTGFIKALINAGANLDATNRYGDTALIVAIYCRNIEASYELIHGGTKLDATNNNGDTALMVAARDNYTPEVVMALIKHGANLDAVSRDGKTALIMAAIQCRADTSVAMALIQAGADLDAKDKDGKTALMSAAVWGKNQLAKALIEAGADLNIRSNFGTALFMPAFNYNREDLKYNPDWRNWIVDDVDLALAVDPHLENLLHIYRNPIVDGGAGSLDGGADTENWNELYARPRCQLGESTVYNRSGYSGLAGYRYRLLLSRCYRALRGDSRISYYDHIFNVLIKSGINPYIKNDNGKTAFDILRTKLEESGITKDEVQYVMESKMQLIPKLTLQNLCRQCIRSQIRSLSCFNQLPLPETVKEYLLYKRSQASSD